jgi:hypothetical protein
MQSDGEDAAVQALMCTIGRAQHQDPMHGDDMRIWAATSAAELGEIDVVVSLNWTRFAANSGEA